MFVFKHLRTTVVNLLLVLGLLGVGLAWSAAAAFADDDYAGAVYTLTNATSGNAVAVFLRADNGKLTPAGAFATGGTGTGGGLGSAGALTLSQDGRRLFAVNVGSNDISSFAVEDGGLTLVNRVPAGGSMPVSVTSYKNLVYVLNAGGSGNIAGLTVDNAGRLAPLSGSSRPLSSSAAGVAQVQFTPDGRVLVVTEKTTNRIDTYRVDAEGRAGPPKTFDSKGTTPFGFDIARNGTVVVSEAGTGSVSSYHVADNGSLTPISPAVPDTQMAACWLVITGNGKYAFTANAASDSISSYRLNADGSLALLNPTAAQEAAGSHPIDMAFSRNSQYLYQLNTFTHTIAGFRVHADGSLTPVGNPVAAPAAAVGLGAR